MQRFFLPFKFIGMMEVEQPRGIEVVRDALPKLKQIQQNQSEDGKDCSMDLLINVHNIKLLDKSDVCHV